MLLALLLTISLGPSRADGVARLAAVGAAAIVARAIFSTPAWRRSFGTFAAPLDIAVDLILILFAMSLTGGLGSELHPLLLVEIFLAWKFLGAAACRFLTASSIFGLFLLGFLSGEVRVPGLIPPPAVVLRIFWPLALFAATEFAGSTAEPSSDRAQGSGDNQTSSLLGLEKGTLRQAPASPPAPQRDSVREVVHDLKSPLSVIRVYADLIAERAGRGETPPEDHIKNLRAEIELMESILGVPPAARRRAREPQSGAERFDLVKILGALAHSYRLAHSDKLKIEFLAEQPEIPIVADLVSLQRAFRNVLENAVKYTPSGGNVRIRVGTAGVQAFVAISDTGTGISEDEIDRAFEFFFRGREARASGTEGTGLGLGLSRELVEANGGRISISSEPGRGSDVTILLPIARETGS